MFCIFPLYWKAIRGVKGNFPLHTNKLLAVCINVPFRFFWNVCVKQKQAAALRFIGYGTGTRICAVQKKIMEELRIENQMTLFELNENILLVRGGRSNMKLTVKNLCYIAILLAIEILTRQFPSLRLIVRQMRY